MHIDHINISAPGELIEEIKDFYCEVFGFNVGFRPDFSTEGYWLYSDTHPLVHLLVCNTANQNENTGFLDHVAFSVEGLPQFAARLTKHNIPYQLNYLKEVNTTQLFFQDPAGLRLEANFKGETFDKGC